MSVLIKGFPTPKNCGACPLRLALWCRERIYLETRPEHCPLIPVPDHGRLIDADALIDSMFDNLVAKTMMFGGQYVYTKDEIESAPTVIPGDKEVKNDAGSA
jgi:hypothetical protein